MIRKCAMEDVDKVSEVLLKSGLGKTPESSKEMFLNEMKQGDIYLIAEEEIPLGIVSWKMEGEIRHGLAEIYHVGVIAKAQGKGIGTKLFEAVIENINYYYKERGGKARKIYLKTHADNKAAQALYNKIGMSHEATLPDHFHKGTDEFVFSMFLE